MKKSFLFFTIALVTLIVFTVSPISAEFAAHGMDLTMEIKIHKQRKAAQASERIGEFFNSCSQKDPYDPYPDYYAGGYIDDKNVYHACFVDAPNKHVDECIALLKEYGSSGSIEYRKYSFNEMHDYATKIADELKALGCIRYSWCVDIPGNAVNIYISEDSMSLAKKNLEQIADNPDIKVNLKVGSPLVFQSSPTTLVGGDKLGTYEGFITLAATGTYNGYDAFLTCGHSLNVGDNVYYSTTTTSIGTVKVNRGNNPNGSFDGDFSIGKLNSNFSPSHKAKGNNSSTILWKGTATTLNVGTYVKKYGATSGYAYLKILAINENFDLGLGHLYKMVTAKLETGTTAGGDSGGPYWTGDYEFCGVHSGITYDKRVVFTPYSVIKSTGFSAYAQHTGSCEYYDSSRHRVFCSLCDGYSYEYHSGNWTDYNTTYHKTYCSICKTTVYELHSAYYNNLLGKCTRCGHTGTITNAIDPDLPLNSPPEAVDDTHCNH